MCRQAAVRAPVSPPAAVRWRWPAGHGQAAGRRLVQGVVASSSTSASESTWSEPSALRSKWVGTIATPWVSTPAASDVGAVDAQQCGRAGAEQPAHRLGFPADRLQGAVQWVVVVPGKPVGALVDVAGPLLGVDDEHARGADHQVVDVRAGI